MKRLLLGLTVLAMLVVFIQPVQAQTPTPPLYIRNMVRDMTPEERVGQLFLVSFLGNDASETSQIYDLIVNYHIGGVTLSATNDNFIAAPDTASDVYRMIAQLQQVERDSSGVPISEGGSNRMYVPLWIGVTQEGNGAPTDQILNGLTPLPSAMALGATWQPHLAEQAGTTAGRELSALGFNMFFGPSLDVLEQPILAPNGDLNTRVFGGDPYWVSLMGQAYVRGLHAGSNSRLLVVAKHFPGRGSADRLPEVEVATVRKSLEQLKQIELAPFFAVTGNAPDAQAMADGLLISHLRFQGLLGNVRATTRPLSFDAQALSAILSLPEFIAWRDNGGMIISDDLGSRAVLDFYMAGATTFNARLVARDAFLAGNDMLYLGNIVSSDAADNYTTVKQILEYFAQKYREDPAFAARVDAALTRILTRKYQLYGVFVDVKPTPDPESLTTVLDTSSDLAFQVATNAATLISPDEQELDLVLPSPPVASDFIVFLTDTRTAKQCSTCPEDVVFATDALQQSVLRLYGQDAGGQVIPSHLTSYTFKDLSNMLNGTGGEFVEPDLRRASWVVISLADASEGQPDLIRRLLSDRQDLLRNSKVILFSFGAPYYFDSTDISKLTAYFVLYSKTSPFVDVAARILFRELPLPGHSPVSIPGIGYDLISVTAPDPAQIISLFLDLPTAAPSPDPSSAQTAEPTVVPQMRIGDTISIRTGELLDQNGNIVPDGTVVRFSVSVTGEGGGLIEQADAQTVGGVARISYRLAKPGLLEFRAASEPAIISQVLQLDVAEGAPMIVTVIVPFTTETIVPTPSTVTPMPESDFVTLDGRPRFGGWLLILFVLAGGAWLAYWVGGSVGSSRWRVRWMLCALVGGLLAYNYLALGLPGGTSVLADWGGGALVGITILGEVLGAIAAWLWMRRSAR